MRHPTRLPLVLAATLLALGACAGKNDAANDSEAADSVAPGMVTGTTGAPGPGTVGTPGTPAAPNPDTIGGDSTPVDTTVPDTTTPR